MTHLFLFWPNEDGFDLVTAAAGEKCAKALTVVVKQHGQGGWETLDVAGVHESIGSIYSVAARAAYQAKNPLLRVRVLLDGLSDTKAGLREALQVGFQESSLASYRKLPRSPATAANSLKHQHSLKHIPLDRETRVVPNTVVLGGTFDHLHQGHLILLSMAAFLASKKLICGVTDFANTPQRLLKKAYHELMEPLFTRTEAVREFLTIFKPTLEYQVVGILDDFGPTRTDPDMDVIVASGETEAGCFAVNTLRKENGLRELDIYLIGVVGNPVLSSDKDESVDFSSKISSSYLRQFLSEAGNKS
ncbi:hypothetical protein BDR26DRAFT_866867 [Obelidium mucronatum]|nr:hypothetical protein BDR26DRAFT_866867 [Obelidium mucronatum]